VRNSVKIGVLSWSLPSRGGRYLSRLRFYSVRNMAISESAHGPEAAVEIPKEDGAEVHTSRKKLFGREFYESIGSPKFIVAPMVDRSEFVC
jgi:hypothetical protein